MTKLRFLHIPKTAGSSFARCLSRIYGVGHLGSKRFTFWGEDFATDLERYRHLDPARRASLVMVTGHAPLGTGVEEIDALPTVTFLRDPVERFKSFCQHVSEGKSPGYYPAEGFDLDRFLDHASGANDGQTRHLLGVGNLELPKGSPTVLADRALAVLERRLAAYGITEFFEESLLAFRRALGWKAWPVYTTLNTKSSRRRLVFNERQIDRIRALNEIDGLVYAAARARFLERLHQDAERTSSEMRRFHFWQAAYAPWLSLYRVDHALRTQRNRRRGARRVADDAR